MQEIIGEACAGGDEMLAVIENEQELFIAQIIHDQIFQRIEGQFLQTKRLRQRGDDLRLIAEWREFDHPHAVGKIREQLCADFYGKPCLACAA